jgi:hypothetical protein
MPLYPGPITPRGNNPRNSIAQAIMGQRRMGGNPMTGMPPQSMSPGMPTPPGLGRSGVAPTGGMTPPPGFSTPGGGIGINAFNRQYANIMGNGGIATPPAPGAPTSLLPPQMPGAPVAPQVMGNAQPNQQPDQTTIPGMGSTFDQQQLPNIY